MSEKQYVELKKLCYDFSIRIIKIVDSSDLL